MHHTTLASRVHCWAGLGWMEHRRGARCARGHAEWGGVGMVELELGLMLTTTNSMPITAADTNIL